MAYITRDHIRGRILGELAAAGWLLKDSSLVAPAYGSKEQIRAATYQHRLSRAKLEDALLQKSGKALLGCFASGNEIDPAKFDISLTPVYADTLEAQLFRFATLFWSIPVSRGYGRRMRYLVTDRWNSKVVGIFALGDPVFNLHARDESIGWKVDDRCERLYHVLDAYTLGAVPPYNRLLAGKLISLLSISDTVREDFHEKYRSATTIIGRQRKTASLVLVTTTSSLGRSSIFNRLHLPGEELPAFRSVGYTRGFGHFQVSDELFDLIRSWLRQRKDEYADNHGFGDGPSWRMRAIRRAVDLLDIDSGTMKHGVKREVFLAPTAKNFDRYLRGDISVPRYFSRSTEEIVTFFKERWMIPRSERITDWKSWTRDDSWRLISSLFT